MKPLTAAICLIVHITGVSLSAQEPPTEPIRSESAWIELQRGQRLNDIEFDAEGRVWLRAAGERRLIMKPKGEYDLERLHLSPSSKSNRYQILVRDIYAEHPADLVDRTTGKIINLPIERYAHYLAMWAPDEQHVLIGREYEDDAQLFLVSLPELRIQEVRRKGLGPQQEWAYCGICSWAEEPTVGRLDLESVQWIDHHEFEFVVTIFPCAAYGGDCTNFNVVVDAYRVLANLETNTIEAKQIDATLYRGRREKE